MRLRIFVQRVNWAGLGVWKSLIAPGDEAFVSLSHWFLAFRFPPENSILAIARQSKESLLMDWHAAMFVMSWTRFDLDAYGPWSGGICGGCMPGWLGWPGSPETPPGVPGAGGVPGAPGTAVVAPCSPGWFGVLRSPPRSVVGS